jgi:hypothetical protein
MKVLTRLFQSLSSRQAKREIEEELRLHLDLLTEEHCRENFSLTDARARRASPFW